ncbi:MAG: hypothetical protein LBR58_06150 [Propionibacteriaceae bacterium]|jgi:endonuclease/exonuclease/phosphatase family metal-dependent hydrolase|nr:hypothetical protein [Propionibacteriaceae bacterium]
MRVLWFVVLAAALAGCGLIGGSSPDPNLPKPVPTSAATPEPGEDAEAQADLTVASFDMAAGLKAPPGIPDEEVAMNARLPVMANLLSPLGADIIGLQGSDSSRPGESLGKALGYATVQPFSSAPVLLGSGRFAVITSGSYPLLGDSELVWVRLREEATGQTWYVFNTSLALGDVNAEARLRQTMQVLDAMFEVDPELADPFVLLGDFGFDANDEREEQLQPLRMLEGAGMMDAGAVAAASISDVAGASSYHGMGELYEGKYYPKVVPLDGVRHDFVMVPTGSDVSGFGVITGSAIEPATAHGTAVDRWQGPVASSHSPVVAKFTWS